MKKISHILIFTLICSLFVQTLTVSKAESEVKFDEISQEVKLSLSAGLSASVSDISSNYDEDKIFISKEIYADFAFNAVGLKWHENVPDQTSSEIFIKFFDGYKWTEWLSVDRDEEDRTADLTTSYSFVATDQAEAFQYKIVMHTDDTSETPYLEDITFQYMDTSVKSGGGFLSDLDASLQKLIFKDDLNIISREEWGTDESYRFYDGDEGALEDDDGLSSAIETELWDGAYDSELEIDDIVKYEDGERLSWALEYPEDVDKFIIHHTATTSNLDDPEAAIRAIYYYHAITKGWGDIGYNYIIDQEGNIYEGRYGGDGVVGGHAAGYNVGSIGIALLGNYENVAPSYEALVSLMALIQDKADEFNIDVEGSSRFRGAVIANLLGHRDVDATACPGDYVYDLLPYLRSSIEGTSVYEYDGDEEFAYEALTDWETIYMDPESEEAITFELKNIGTATWNESTYLTANTDYSADRIVDLDKAYMVENSVTPGETATFNMTLNTNILGGFVSFELTPIFNGDEKTSNYMTLPVYAEFPELTYEVENIDIEDEKIENEEETEITIELENTGNVIWRNNGDYPVYLRGDELIPDDVLMIENEVAPGEIATFTFTVTGPEEAGTYEEHFALYFDGVSSAEEAEDSYFEILVYNTSEQASFVEKSDKIEFYPNEEAEVWVELLNTGYQTWTDDNLTVGFLKYYGIEVSDYYLVESSVESEETGKIKFTIEAPSAVGDYKVMLKPRVEGRNLTQSYFYYEFSVVEGGESGGYDQPDVRVKISYDGEAPIITADGDFSMYSNDKLIRYFDEDNKVEISLASDNSYQVKSGGFAWVLNAYPVFKPANSEVIMEIENFENRPSWNTELNDNMYRGYLEVREVDGELNVINELPLESYVKGIAEESNSSPTEKLKTMAILARTYALYYIEIDEKFPDMPYDLDDDPDHCQKYLGYGYESRAPNMVSAVEVTYGLVVTYEGELVKTPYFSSSDGTETKSAEEVWGWTDTPYLISVSDPLCESDSFSGHGVGLSGCGATSAAENGNTYEEIIKYYFTGVEITGIEDL
ncbi:MAG: N-acetylmuramoyl-L-alanine amidase family 2 protein [Candidatus Peregrinibacteria bacterium GW2011_GWF2_43_17]|nr:MAG: N-acetylmuramoyl-L-alanine amidase family 2 protein [Candidatus Peregrinibacteria bacterium GW2011_GWF2_43_17]KKT20596.1 MAG: N-acetylmuramoyl-L-alanine amidase family 2 [Candidatus Peregrinibacteria bacterium GW2011_GWA2_43_8]HAU39885.1 hypothetical protein [Candidatus Peregrinibacteria bacterium]